MNMDASSVPGFGWTTPSRSKVDLYPESYPVDVGDGFPGSAAEKLLSAVGADTSGINALIMETAKEYFAKSETLFGELQEFLDTALSNGRPMKWHVMKIAPNTSFKLHAHQNIEVIYVIRGTMNEVRLSSPPPKRIFPVTEMEGPSLADPALKLQFIQRSTSSTNAPHERFLINEKGSIHLSYTTEEGAELLVLWSGSHGNIPLDQYPADAAEVLQLPEAVQPF